MVRKKKIQEPDDLQQAAARPETEWTSVESKTVEGKAEARPENAKGGTGTSSGTKSKPRLKSDKPKLKGGKPKPKKPKAKPAKPQAKAGKPAKPRLKSGARKAAVRQPAAGYPPVVALDVGTTKIACLIADIDADGNIAAVRGIGNAPALGMHKGVVVDLEDAAAAIRDSVSAAALAAGVQPAEAFVGVAGSHVVSMNRKVSITNPNADGRVTPELRQGLLEKLKQVKVSPDLKLIHALPREYILDGQDGIKRPVGMYAKQIEMAGHLVFGAINSIQNLVAAVAEAGLATDDIVLEPLASSEACLDDQEMKSGVMLVDIGGGTTDVAMFVDGRLVHTSVLPVGGNHITKDISVGLKVPLAAAEEIKIRNGHAESHRVEDIEMIKAVAGEPGAPGERQVAFSRKFLARIIEARVAEIFTLVEQQARDSGYLSSVAAGIVITGGSSQLEGICGLATQVTKLPARQGLPLAAPGVVDIPGNPVYATAVGLLLYGSRQIFMRAPSQPAEVSTPTLGLWNEVLAKVKGWFGRQGKT